MNEPPSPGDGRFLLDAMCGTLATYLRFCGYDAAYALDRGVESDDRLLALAEREGRTLITRDRRLADRAGDAILLTEREVEDQLRELRKAGVTIAMPERPTRCGRCSAPLARLPSDADRPTYVPDDERPVWRCPDCGQCFWRGSHWDDVKRRIEGL